MTNRNRSPFPVDTGVAPSTLDGMGDQGSRLRDMWGWMLDEYCPRDEDGNLYLPGKAWDRLPSAVDHGDFTANLKRDHDPGDEDRS